MKKLVIASGKGGVGKTTVAMNTAKELQSRGYKVGLLDVDIDAPNVPLMMGISEEFTINEKIEPVVKDGIEVASIGIIVKDDVCVMWDGNRRSMAVDQFYNEVNWTCEVLVIDTPPGTTEEIATVIRKLDVEGVVIVSTPHPASIMDIRRTAVMLNIHEIPIIGIIDNMNGFECPNCKRVYPIFGEFPDLSSDEVLESIPIIAHIPWTENVRDVKSFQEAIDEMEGYLL